MTQSDYPVEPFDRLAPVYDEFVSRGEGFPYEGYDAVLDQVVTAADVRPGMYVLELGVGTGNLARRFVDAGCNVWGVDFSEQMLAQAAVKAPGAKLIQADLLADFLRVEEMFDRIVSSYALHHFDLPTKVRLITRIASHRLRSDGKIVIADIGFPTAEARSEAKERFAAAWEEDEHYWAADEAIEAFARRSLQCAYKQVAVCAGVLTLTLRPAPRSGASCERC